jgi:hypothetical protein
MYGQQVEKYGNKQSVFRYDDDKDEARIQDTLVRQTFSHELGAEISMATLELEATAGTYKLLGTTAELIRADKSGSRIAYNFRVEELGEHCKVIIEQVDDKIVLNSNKLNKFDLMLNADINWSFDLEVGAAELDFDLRDYKVQEIVIDGGAAAIDLRFGDKLDETTVSRGWLSRYWLNCSIKQNTKRFRENRSGCLRDCGFCRCQSKDFHQT